MILQMSLLSVNRSFIVSIKNFVVVLMGVLLLLLAPNLILRASYRLKKLRTSLLHVQVSLVVMISKCVVNLLVVPNVLLRMCLLMAMPGQVVPPVPHCGLPAVRLRLPGSLDLPLRLSCCRSLSCAS
ncbi:unnamed protein product [Prorocentrum cordatum]|uniref:Uncharacterized protein n=1 Tax=Prorocentrum cordatum TaxID=2364126 RepID=A0ABN9SHB9_9DINO|nr:unnamed protein product [Polarella glacialis]